MTKRSERDNDGPTGDSPHRKWYGLTKEGQEGVNETNPEENGQEMNENQTYLDPTADPTKVPLPDVDMEEDELIDPPPSDGLGAVGQLTRTQEEVCFNDKEKNEEQEGDSEDDDDDSDLYSSDSELSSDEDVIMQEKVTVKKPSWQQKVSTGTDIVVFDSGMQEEEIKQQEEVSQNADNKTQLAPARANTLQVRKEASNVVTGMEIVLRNDKKRGSSVNVLTTRRKQMSGHRSLPVGNRSVSGQTYRNLATKSVTSGHSNKQRATKSAITGEQRRTKTKAVTGQVGSVRATQTAVTELTEGLDEGNANIERIEETVQSFFYGQGALATFQGCGRDRKKTDELATKVLCSLMGTLKTIDEAVVVHPYPTKIEGKSVGKDFPMDLLLDKKTGHYTNYMGVEGVKAVAYLNGERGISAYPTAPWAKNRTFNTFKFGIYISHSWDRDSLAEHVRQQWGPVVQSLMPLKPEESVPYIQFEAQQVQTNSDNVVPVGWLLFSHSRINVESLREEFAAYTGLSIGVKYEQLYFKKRFLLDIFKSEEILKESSRYLKAIKFTCSLQAVPEVQAYLQEIYSQSDEVARDDGPSTYKINRTYQLVENFYDVAMMPKKQKEAYIKIIQQQVNFVKLVDQQDDNQVLLSLPKGFVRYMDTRVDTDDEDCAPTLREVLTSIPVCAVSTEYNQTLVDGSKPNMRKIIMAVEDTRYMGDDYHIIANPNYFREAQKLLRSLIPFIYANYGEPLMMYFTDNYVTLESGKRWDTARREIVGAAQWEQNQSRMEMSYGMLPGIKLRTPDETLAAKKEEEKQAKILERKKAAEEKAAKESQAPQASHSKNGRSPNQQSSAPNKRDGEEPVLNRQVVVINDTPDKTPKTKPLEKGKDTAKSSKKTDTGNKSGQCDAAQANSKPSGQEKGRRKCSKCGSVVNLLCGRTNSREGTCCLKCAAARDKPPDPQAGQNKTPKVPVNPNHVSMTYAERRKIRKKLLKKQKKKALQALRVASELGTASPPDTSRSDQAPSSPSSGEPQLSGRSNSPEKGPSSQVNAEQVAINGGTAALMTTTTKSNEKQSETTTQLALTNGSTPMAAETRTAATGAGTEATARVTTGEQSSDQSPSIPAQQPPPQESSNEPDSFRTPPRNNSNSPSVVTNRPVQGTQPTTQAEVDGAAEPKTLARLRSKEASQPP